mmetsp:Transcript_66956/g.104679  ORF Transcript_66956/g.104679 Transcript_66956/m.104679 type:complete len:202 (-) Transcript_66956:102-707(-)
MVSDYKMVNEEERQAILSAETDEYKPAPPQRSYRGRIIACVVGFALLGAVFYATSSGNSTSLRKGNVGDSVQLSGADDSTWYLIRHDFKHDDDAAPWWKKFQKLTSNATAIAGWSKAVAEVGWYNAVFMPTAKGGPFFCLWQGMAGATKEDMEDFINTNKLSPAGGMINTVMPIPLALVGGKPPVTPVGLGKVVYNVTDER